MPGLSRFDFYPRDWHLDTRDLTQAAKGIYIDLLSAMYARGGPLPNDQRELCRITGCATVRSLRPLLEELIAKEKIRLVDGTLVNNRAMKELAAADIKMARASAGGKAKKAAVQREFGSNSARTHAETQSGLQLIQCDNPCLPSPSPPSVLRTGDKWPKNGFQDTSPSPAAVIFGTCLNYLVTTCGQKEDAARKILGVWRRDHGDWQVIEAVTAASRRDDISDPVGWIGGYLRRHQAGTLPRREGAI